MSLFFSLQINATAGKLVKIVLTNFMCHGHIEVTFHENVNVILGRNGSKPVKNFLLTGIIIINMVYLHNRWKECDNGSHYSWVGWEGNYHQQEHFTTAVHTDRLQVVSMTILAVCCSSVGKFLKLY